MRSEKAGTSGAAVGTNPAIHGELRQQQGLAAKALEFAILTAARSGEVREMPWEGQIAGDVWTIPGRPMKGGKEHKVPPAGRRSLSSPPCARSARTGFVFPGETGDQPMSDMTLTEVIRRWNQARKKAGLSQWVDPKQGNRDVVSHGFRSTFRDWVDEDTRILRLDGGGGACWCEGRQGRGRLQAWRCVEKMPKTHRGVGAILRRHTGNQGRADGRKCHSDPSRGVTTHMLRYKTIFIINTSL
jgi:integrase